MFVLLSKPAQKCENNERYFKHNYTLKHCIAF